MRIENRILSRPVRLNWSGWETDTFRLQQAGWSLSADQDVCRNQIQLAFRNERAGMVGISGAIDWDYYHYSDAPSAALPVLPVKMISHKIMIEHYGGLPSFRPIDAQPQMVTSERTCLEDFAHFAPAHTRTQQLIVPEETVEDLMGRILEMQQGPRIERIRAEVSEGSHVEFQERQKFHAQIVSIAA